MDVSRRLATFADTDFALRVHHRAYRDIIERQYGDWNVADQDKFFMGAWSAAAHDIVFCDGVRCGYTCIEDRDREIYIRELVIDPDYQGRGIGTRLIKDVFADSSARGVPVRLQTQTLNRAATLYRRLGFRETDRTETHIRMEWRPADSRLDLKP
jgi:ribosomal protein S18 acetylase RimI-like enzyme